MNAMLNFGGTLKHIWMWSGIKCPSISSTRFWRHSSPTISPTAVRNLPYKRLFRYLGTITTWYLQSHLTCDKLCQSCIGSSSSSAKNTDFPGGRTYFISRRNGRTFPGPPPEVEGLDQTKKKFVSLRNSRVQLFTSLIIIRTTTLRFFLLKNHFKSSRKNRWAIYVFLTQSRFFFTRDY